MKRCSFCFWFFYASRAAIGVVLHMGAHQYVFFDSGLTLIFAICAFGKVLVSGGRAARSTSSRQVFRWVFLYLAWAAITLTWTPAPALLAGGKLLKIVLELGIVLCLISDPDIREITSSSIKGFLYGGIFAVSLYGFYPVDITGRAGVEGGLEGYEIARMTTLAAVMAFIQWTNKPDRRSAVQAVVLAGGVLILVNKSCIGAYCMAIAPFALRAGAKALTKTLVALSLLAWLVFPWVAPYLMPYIYAEGYLTLTGRLFIWADAWNDILAKPILGSGYDSAKVLLVSLGDFSPGHAHNEWLQNWMCLGLIGVLLLLGIYVSFTKLSWKYRKLPIGQMAIALLLFGLVRGITDPSIDLSPPMGLILLFATRMGSLSLPLIGGSSV